MADSIKVFRRAPSNPNSSSLHQQQRKKSACDLFKAEVEINDIRPAARNVLTKGQTHDEISQYAGASISTRGRFISAAEKRSGVPITDRSLYLFIQASTKDSVDLAVQRIEEIIQMDNPANFRAVLNVNSSIPNSVQKFAPQPTLPMTMPPPIVSGGMAITSTTNTGPTNATCVEKIFIGLDHAPPSFDLRSRLIGTGGANLNYIRTETGAMATLRGRGSLFVDPLLNTESPEPIHLYIEHLRYEGLQAAKQLARNLIETLQQELVQFQQMNPPMSNIHFSAQTNVVQQPHIYTQHTMTQPPPPVLTLPPPHPPAQIQQQATTTIMQTHQLPLQMHPQGLVQMQPPTLPIPMKTMVPNPTVTAAPPPHLSQPPPSIQHLQHPPTQTQIVVNQSVPIPIKTMVPMMQTAPQPNYQYQYIHTTGQEATAVPQPPAGPSGAVTIQHIYQSPHPSLPPQHVQSIMQPSTSFADVTTTTFAQQMIRPPPVPQAPPPTQQYITVQGNTTYMVPPPSLIQTSSQVPTSSIIYSSHPPPQVLQQPPNYSMAQQLHATTHQMITVQQHQPQPPPPQQGEVKLEEKTELECGMGKLEDFAEAHQRSTMVSTMTAPPPIMSVPPPTVQHMMANSYATNQMQQQQQSQPQIYGQPPMSHAPGPPTSQPPGQQFVINSNGWPHPVTSSQPPNMPHLSQQPPALEYSQGTGGTTYQQIQHPIMTTATSMGMPVQYPQMPPMMNRQVPPPPFSAAQGVMQTGPPPQPVPFPIQQQPPPPPPPQEGGKGGLMRPGQKRKLVEDNGGEMISNKNGHGDPNNRHGRMTGTGGGGMPYHVATSSAGNAVSHRVMTATSNTNSNDLNQDNYAATGHRLDERSHAMNQMTMPGDLGDHPHQTNTNNCGGLSMDAPGDEGAYPSGDLSHPPPPPPSSVAMNIKAIGPPPPASSASGQMSMVRCNIMGKPPPPMPLHMNRGPGDSGATSILTNVPNQQQMQRYGGQW